MLVHVEMQGSATTVSVEVDADTGLEELKARAREAVGLAEHAHVSLLLGGEEMEGDEDVMKLDEGETIAMACGCVVERHVASVRESTSLQALFYVEGTEFAAPGPLTGIWTHAARFTDQGWGNYKGQVFLVKCPGGQRPKERTGDLCTSLLGIARRQSEQDNVFRLTPASSCIAVDAGDVLMLAFQTGGGGGHELFVDDLNVKMSFGGAGLPVAPVGARVL